MLGGTWQMSLVCLFLVWSYINSRSLQREFIPTYLLSRTPSKEAGIDITSIPAPCRGSSSWRTYCHELPLQGAGIDITSIPAPCKGSSSRRTYCHELLLLVTDYFPEWTERDQVKLTLRWSPKQVKKNYNTNFISFWSDVSIQGSFALQRIDVLIVGKTKANLDLAWWHVFPPLVPLHVFPRLPLVDIFPRLCWLPAFVFIPDWLFTFVAFE